MSNLRVFMVTGLTSAVLLITVFFIGSAFAGTKSLVGTEASVNFMSSGVTMPSYIGRKARVLMMFPDPGRGTGEQAISGVLVGADEVFIYVETNTDPNNTSVRAISNSNISNVVLTR